MFSFLCISLFSQQVKSVFSLPCRESWVFHNQLKDNECDYACLKNNPSEESSCFSSTNQSNSNNCSSSCNKENFYCNLTCVNNSCSTGCIVGNLGNKQYDPECDVEDCYYDLGDTYYKKTPVEYFVDLSSNSLSEDGSFIKPFKSLDTALNKCRHWETVIFLKSETVNLDQEVSYLSKPYFKTLTIKPYFCNGTVQEHCVMPGQRSTIFLKNSLSSLAVDTEIIFENIDFSHEFLFTNCSGCQYCRSFTIKNNIFYNDRDEALGPNETYSSSECDKFKNFTLFSIKENGFLNLTNVRFHNMRMGYKHLIYNSKGKLVLNNVDFYNIYSKDWVIKLENSTTSYSTGKISLLNNGFELNKTSLTGFLTANNESSLIISKVDFQYNINTDLASSFFNFDNIQKLDFSDTNFKFNFCPSALVQITSDSKSSIKASNTLKNLNFTKNFCSSAFSLTLSSDIFNFEDLLFEDNIFKTTVDVSYYQKNNDPSSSSEIVFENINFMRNDAEYLFKCQNQNKLIMKNMRLEGNRNDLNENDVIFQTFKSQPEVYFKGPARKTSNNPVFFVSLVMITNSELNSIVFSSNLFAFLNLDGTNSTLKNILIQNNNKVDSSQGQISIKFKEKLTISSLNFENNSFKTSIKELFSITSSNTNSSKAYLNSIIIQNSKGSISLGDISALNLVDFQAESNYDQTSPLIEINLSGVSEIFIQNFKISGLRQQVLSVNSIWRGETKVKMDNFNIKNVNGKTPLIFIQVSLLSSQENVNYLKDSVFFNNTGSVFEVISNAGKFLVQNSTFTSNTGNIAVLGLESDIIMTLDKCVFKENVGRNIISIFTNSNTTGIITKDSVFEGNNGVVIKNDGSLFKDYRSLFLKNDYQFAPVLKGGLYSLNYFISSNISENNSKEKGCIYASWKSKVILDSCTSSFNKAQEVGGVIYVDQNSILQITNSTFNSNKATQGSSIYIQNSQSSENFIKTSTFSENLALLSGTITVLDSSISISSTFLLKNQAHYESPGLIITYNSKLILSNSHFSSHSGDSSHLTLEGNSNGTISNSSFKSGNSSEISSGIRVYNSNLQCTLCTFEDFESHHSSTIFCSRSNCSFISSSFKEIRGGNDAKVLQADLSSKVSVVSSEFYLYSGTGVFVGYKSMAQVDDSRFWDANGFLAAGVTCKDCQLIEVQNCTFTNLTGVDNGGAVQVQSYSSESQSIIRSSMFSENSSPAGGAIFNQDTNLSIIDSVFTGNSAKDSKGGAIYSLSSQTLSILNCEFSNNSAVKSGGAIQWYGKSPVLKNLRYRNNFAEYGNDIASFAYKLIFNQSNFTSAPGQNMEDFYLFVLDHNDNIINTDNSSTASISVVNTSNEISGPTSVISKSGMFYFSGITVRGMPLTSVELMITPIFSDRGSLFDDSQVEKNLTIFVSMRNCLVGEELIEEKICSNCKTGTFNLKAGEKCKSCPDGATCDGSLQGKKGYWRSSNFSDNFIECPNPDACLKEEKGQVRCLTGYKGNCCQSCKKGYMRTFESECSECPSHTNSVVIISFVLIADAVLMYLMTSSSIKDSYKEQSITSTYYKIFLNYCQFVSLSVSISLSWPGIIQSFFMAQKRATGGAEQFTVVDCLISEKYEPIYTKLIILSLIPVICLTFTGIFWKVLSLFKETSFMKEKLVGSLVVQLFFFQPSLVKYTFSIFNCSELDPGEMFLTDELSIPCWKRQHLTFALAVALPSLLIWCLAIPLTLLVIMFRYRESLNTLPEMLKYGFLYKEYKTDKFYWEFFTMFRKLLMTFVSVFLKNQTVSIQGLATLVIVSVGFFLQDRLKPYKYEQLNTMELWSIMSSGVTIYAGMFLFEGISGDWEKVLIGLIFIINLMFLGYWAYYALGYYLGKIYLKFPVFQKVFKRRFDTWARKIVPELKNDEKNKQEDPVSEDEKIQGIFDEKNSCKTAVNLDERNSTKVEIFVVQKCNSLESENDEN